MQARKGILNLNAPCRLCWCYFYWRSRLANAKSYIEFSRSDDMAMALQRTLALRSVLTPNSVVVVLSFRDGISRFVERFPFHQGSP